MYTHEQAEAESRELEKRSRALALLANPDFAFFLEHCVQEELDTANTNALSLLSDDRKRDQAAHIYAAMLRVRDWAKENAPQ